MQQTPKSLVISCEFAARFLNQEQQNVLLPEQKLRATKPGLPCNHRSLRSPVTAGCYGQGMCMWLFHLQESLLRLPVPCHLGSLWSRHFLLSVSSFSVVLCAACGEMITAPCLLASRKAFFVWVAQSDHSLCTQGF